MREAFSRLDEGEDSIFYKRDRFVSHLDSTALSTVRDLIGTLIIEKEPVILDLMAGWDSHIPEDITPARVVGLGLNISELKRNQVLDEFIIHDLNKEPILPFPDRIFDAVINTISVDYMTQPLEVFREVGRILKPGGLFLVIFSNRMFPEKAVKIWRESDENERVLMVEDLFKESGSFDKQEIFLAKGRPRPRDDKYFSIGIPSDPVYAVYAERRGGDPCRKRRPVPVASYGEIIDGRELDRRKKSVWTTLRCPYCGEKLKKWAVPENPFCCTWDNDFMYICFNDECPYFVRGWDHMYKEGNRGVSYRLMYNPVKDFCSPIPVPSHRALRDGIMETETADGQSEREDSSAY